MSTGEPAPERAGEDRQANREAILLAATRVIARRGVRGLRVEQVASDAGVSPGLLYYHFESRAGLISATLERAAQHAPSARIMDGQASGPGLEAVAGALLGELDTSREVRDGAVVWGEIGASAVFDADVRAGLERAWNGWRDSVATGLRAGVADGSVRADTDPIAAADMLISLVDGLCTRWLSGTLERERALTLLGDQIARLAAE